VSRVDLHCHYLPGVDDGVRTIDESQRLLRGLRDLGYAQVIATPHIRSGMFDNQRAGLVRAFDELAGVLGDAPDLPERGLSAEHYFDDVFVGLIAKKEALPYPGGKAVLVEFHYDLWPRGIERQFFKLEVVGLRPVIAHPERYRELERRSDALEVLMDAGALTLLDLMALVGKYGERSRRTAERLLEEGLYDAACSDSHRPEDVEIVAKGIARLEALAGKDDAEAMLGEVPRGILDGSYEP
jgi:protein-tyrosine phosphatase